MRKSSGRADPEISVHGTRTELRAGRFILQVTHRRQEEFDNQFLGFSQTMLVFPTKSMIKIFRKKKKPRLLFSASILF